MTHIQALGGEGVGLDLDIRTGDLVYEAGLADIRETWNNNLLLTVLKTGPFFIHVKFISDRIM